MIHQYNNGVKMYNDCVLRKENIINYHEPVEDLIVTEILLNSNCETLVNIGCSYGYYLLLASLYDYHVIGYEKQIKRSKRIYENLKLNNVVNYDIFEKECNRKDIHDNDDIGNFLLMDVQGAEARLLKDNIKNYFHVVIGTHKMGKIDTHQKIIDILEKQDYSIKYECEPGKVNFQPDGIVWGAK